MIIQVTIPAVPVAQPRARATIRGKHAGMYTPDTIKAADGTKRPHPIAAFKASVRHEMALAYTSAPIEGPLLVSAKFIFPRPGRLLKKKSPPDRVRHTSKPDLDNLCKSLWDAMTSRVFVDDSQICTGLNEKWYAAIGEQPHVAITIATL